MIVLKTAREIDLMRKAGSISAGALQVAGELIADGVSTLDIDKRIKEYIVSRGARPNFLNYNGFPASACISLNDEVIHGIPSAKRKLKTGDIVKVDVGAEIDGYHGDNAMTFKVGQVSADAERLMQATQQSLVLGLAAAQEGNRVGDISHAVQRHIEGLRMAVVTRFVGHGIGRKLHEAPDVPNFGAPGRGPKLLGGMTIAIEPMVNLIGEDVYILGDGWTVKTKSGSLSAHYEHTVAITKNGPVILTEL